MANRGLLRGRGVNPGLGFYRFATNSFIQGGYPTQPWTARLPRPSLVGPHVIHAPHSMSSLLAALTVNDTVQAANVKGGNVRPLFLITDSAGVAIAQIFNAGGAYVSGDRISAGTSVVLQPASNPTAGIDGTTLPASLFWASSGLPGIRFYAGSGTPTGGVLSFNGQQSNAGDLYYNKSGAAGARLYVCTVAGSPGTWTACTGV